MLDIQGREAPSKLFRDTGLGGTPVRIGVTLVPPLFDCSIGDGTCVIGSTSNMLLIYYNHIGF